MTDREDEEISDLTEVFIHSLLLDYSTFSSTSVGSDISLNMTANTSNKNGTPAIPAYKYTPTIAMLTAPIPTFSGKSKDLQDFLDAAQTAHIESVLFAQIMQKLNGVARGNSKSHPEVKTWESLKQLSLIHISEPTRPY